MPLEHRTLLATLVSATKLTYQDQDGDNVEVTLSKPVLTAGNVNSVFAFDVSNVNGSNTTKQQLRTISMVGVAVATLTTITTKAVRSAVNGGDGFAALGQINATGLDIGTVTIDGDLGRILAGDAVTTTQGLDALSVHSMGQFGTFTGAVDLNSVIQGKLLSLKSKTDVKGAFINVQGGLDGQIGSITIGGSLLGGAAVSSGSITSTSNIGAVIITGDVEGGAGAGSGRIRASGKLASTTIGGSLIGGVGSDSGVIFSVLDIGTVKVTGDVKGGGGAYSGLISTLSGKLASVTIGGSLIGGGGYSSGVTFSQLDTGAVKVTGDVAGGVGSDSGQVASFGKLASVTIGGSLRGGSANNSGRILSVGELSTLTITGSIRGGSASGVVSLQKSGLVEAGRIGTLTLGGSLIAGTDTTSGTFENNGAIRVSNDIASLTVKGSIIGNATNRALITARGQLTPAGTTDLAIGKLTVSGRVEHALIHAGVTTDGIPLAKNADAQIGPVIIGLDWIGSSLVAGALAGVDDLFGTVDDVIMAGAGVKNAATVFSKITSIVIGGQAFGTVGAGDHFGFVAQNIGSFKLKGGTTTFPLVVGNGNDDFFVGLLGDLKVNEI